MNRALIDEMLVHARATAPREACGFVVSVEGVETVVLCRNMAEEDTTFILHPADFAKCEDMGRLVACWHSHDGKPEPSSADRAQCEKHRIPFVIVSASLGSYTRIDPTGWVAPLEGREWLPCIQDCADLVRDFYSRELGIELPNPERGDHWWTKGQDLIAELHAEVGFAWVPKQALRKHDVLVFLTSGDVPHHVGVYLGDSLMLHHPYGQLSRRSQYDDHWKHATFGVLRHRSLLLPGDAFHE